MPITLDRSICCNFNETISREWLVTNGMGGYASGTVSGVLTRMQHGLLVALPPNAQIPQLLLAKLDEEVVFDQRTYYLGTNEYRDGTLNPSGFVHLETFRLEEGFPIFTYHLGGMNGIMLEKRIWMPQGANTTYIQYRVLRTATTNSHSYRRSAASGPLSHTGGSYSTDADMAQGALSLTLLPFSTYRPHDKVSEQGQPGPFQVRQLQTSEMVDKSDWMPGLPQGSAGCTVLAGHDAQPYHLLAVGHPSSRTTFLPTDVWYWNFLRRQDAIAGRPATDDLYLPGVFRTTLWPDEEATLTIIVTTEELSSLSLRLGQLNLSYKKSVEKQQHVLQQALQPQRYFGEGGEAAQPYHTHVLPLSTASDPQAGGEEYLSQLLQASERFLVKYRSFQREFAGDHNILFGKAEHTVVLLSEYYGMESKTRDALIALPGLTLVAGRYDEAKCILRGFARHFKHGLLPDQLSIIGGLPEHSDYTGADTSLWFFYTLDHYLRASHDYDLLNELFPHLVDCISWYIRGTQGIQLDPTDALLRAHQPGKALTWMNAMLNGAPVTPRSGKTVELNALWHHALALMLEWSDYLSCTSSTHSYQELLTQCKRSFQQRFWYEDGGYLYDVIDGPEGAEQQLRPNQLLALSLRYPILDTEAYRQSIFEAITDHLLTPYGLRTLAPYERAYRGRLDDHVKEQQQALHQGSIWTWLIGPYIDTLLSLKHASPARLQSHDNDLYNEYLWRKGLHLLETVQRLKHEGLLGMSGSVFDGDEPHHASYCVTSALSIGELLRIYSKLALVCLSHPHHAFSR